MKHLKFSFQFFAILLISFNQLHSQPHTNIKFEKLLDKDELLSNVRCNAIIQDYLGYMWFATDQTGLVKYDANEITFYPVILENSPTSFGSTIFYVYEDTDSNLWISGLNGIAKLNREAGIFKQYLPEPDSVHISKKHYNAIEFITEDLNRNLLLTSLDGLLYCFDKTTEKFERIGNQEGTLLLRITNHNPLYRNKIYAADNGILWLGSNNGLWTYDQNTKKLTPCFYSGDDNDKKQVDDIYEDANKDIWVSSRKGLLARFNATTGNYRIFNAVPGNPDSLRNDTCRLYIDKKGDVWAGSWGCLSQYIPKRDVFKHYFLESDFYPYVIYEESNGDFWLSLYSSKLFNTILAYFEISTGKLIRFEPDEDKENSFPFAFITDFYKDYSGTYWISSFNKGIVHYTPLNNQFTPYIESGKATDSIGSVWCVFETGDTLWFGSDRGLFAYNTVNHNLQNWNKNKGINNEKVYTIAKDHENGLWLGTKRGINKMNLKTGNIEHIHVLGDSSNLLPNSDINNIFIDSRNTIWISTDGNGLMKLTPSNPANQNVWEYHCYKDPDDLYWGINYPRQIVEDQGGNIWIISPAGGLNLYHPETNKLENFTDHKNNFYGGHSICESKDNKIWIASYFSGLHLFDPDQQEIVKSYNRENGYLPESSFSRVIIDKEENLWITAATTGLYKFDPVNETARLFSKKDGFEAQPMTKPFVNENGFLFYGGKDKIYKFHPDSLLKDTIPPLLHLTALRLFNKKVLPSNENSPLDKIIEETSQITLSHDQNIIGIEYTAMHYVNPEQINFAFILEGLEDEWQDVGNRRFANYTGLQAGNYTFKLKAENCDGVWSKELKLKITILPPWWRTIIAYISYVVLLLLIIYTYIKYREKALRHEKDILEKKVQTRTREIQDKNEELKEQKEEILTANEELEQQKEEIQVINENLTQQNEEIISQKDEIQTINENLMQKNEEIVSQRDEIEAQRNLALDQKDQIETHGKSITDSIQYAKRIQSAILPPDVYINELLPENFILYKPRDIVSGDFYWVKHINNYIILVAADCTGHGVPGAFMSMLGISFLNEIVQQREITQANEVLNELRRQIKRSLRQHGKKDGSKDGMDIALCAIDTKTNIMQYAGAFNPLVLFKYKKGKSELTEIKADRMPVGIYLGREQSFTNHEIKLEIGDTFYIFSDGYPDQTGKNGKKFMTKNFKELLLEIQNESMAEQKEILERRLSDWMGNESQVDDILVVGVRIE